MLQQLNGGNSMPAHAIDLDHRAYPELAAALRATIETILQQWRNFSLKEMPHLDRFTIEQFENDLRIILESVAVAMDSADLEHIRSLLESAPRHGFERFISDADLLDLFMEERILRGVMVVAIEDKLDRKMETDEAASLHATIDVMIQQGVLAMVQKQKEKLREAAEAELKFLSFFSHDLNNNMFVIFSSLDTLKKQLQGAEQFEAACHVIDNAQRTIKHTSDGMRRLLHHEHVRRSEEKPVIAEINLHEKFRKIASFYKAEAKAKGMRIVVDVDPDAVIATDPDLLYIILQNIIGNAVKHCDHGEVRMEAQPEQEGDRQKWRISIADRGPGIEREQLGHIFDAFKRGQTLGAEGVGLGLAITAQAAKLLNATIDVDTTLGEGTTFHIRLPVTSRKKVAAGL